MPERRTVYLLTPNLTAYDAIGNDVLGMAQCLRHNGYPVHVLAGNVDASAAEFARTLDAGGEPFWKDSDALLIYHHSTGWPEGQAVLRNSKNHLVVKYHNITPPQFFEPYSEPHAEHCKLGQEANYDVARRQQALFWGDSRFNCEDLISYGANPEKCHVLPPFHITEKIAMAPIDPGFLSRYKALPGIKLLFVGGIKPNKGHLNLLRLLSHCCISLKRDFTLIVAGGLDYRLHAYWEELQRYIESHGLERRVVFTKNVTDSQLRTLYLISDVFICLSDHEGFCVPLVESMYFRLPIIARNNTAIPETVGGAGLIWPDDLDYYVESIEMCAEDDTVSRSLRAAGRERYEERYSPAVISGELLKLVDEAIS